MPAPNRRRQIQSQLLESRRMLAAFGTPWPDPSSLSISFAHDGSDIHGQDNEIHSQLDALADRQEWQELALRAFQTWSYVADINVALTNDAGADFGTPGLQQNDPRFGEFRIGSIPQSGALANTLPFQVMAGTLSGDLLLNSATNFAYHDWAGGAAPDPTPPESPQQFDLFSVFLHEAGNALGIEDNDLTSSVMFQNYTVPKGILTAQDIADIQALYGQRSDDYESADNGSLLTASLIANPAGFDPAGQTIRVRGSLKDAADVDVYRYVPLSLSGDVTVTLQAREISLLQGKIELLNLTGGVLASAEADSVFDNDVSLTLGGLSAQQLAYIRVTGADGDVYSAGDYDLVIDYRSDTVQASDLVTPAYDSLAEHLWQNFDLIDDEVGATDVIADAVPLPLMPGGIQSHRQEVLSSVGGTNNSGSTDVDVWKVAAPANVSGAMRVHLSPIGGDAAADLKIQILDASGATVGASGRLAADGTWTLDVDQPTPGAEYFLRISVDPSSAVDVGNYVASAEFTPAFTDAHEMFSRTIQPGEDEFVRWNLRESKMYRFDLSATAASDDAGVRLTVYDAFTKEVVLVVGATAGGSRSVHAMLDSGDYILRFAALSRGDAPVQAVDASLFVHGLSDDQDPGNGSDPDEGDSDYDPYYYYDDYDYDYDYYYYYYDPFGYDDYYSSYSSN
ncbi:matrixin family metalloprotease [Crateriforma conspicua]|uniref:Matrixin n=1 Tax=Crateriforma conspicua TaxID=2527996 RepID=A0A5C6FVP6_9PLAN|nr:matrixin family metalloprotease [Crateriforma conspicua]TWU65695.1 Matrixin [Crateriforma conspicua]